MYLTKALVASLIALLGLNVAVFASPSDQPKADNDTANRIYGGQSRRNNNYDFVAKLTVFFNGWPTKICSGVVLTDKVIITVAHCLSPPGRQRANSVLVMLPVGGIYTFNKNEIFIHPKFNKIYGHDVAILRKYWIGLSYMINYGNPPRLPEDYINYDNAVAVIAGWGKFSDNLLFSSGFQYADVTIMKDRDCKEKNPRLSQSMDINDDFICSSNSLAGICEGDWGGPILIKRKGFVELAGLSMFTQKTTCNSKYQKDSQSTYYALGPVVSWVKDYLL